MIESPLIAQLLAGAVTKAKVEILLRVLQKRYRELPEEVTAAVHTCTDNDQLDRWLDAAAELETLEEFRRQTGL
jgi:hypothetical protein